MRGFALALCVSALGCSGGGVQPDGGFMLLRGDDLAVPAGCQKDTDCKGARLCVSGACVDVPDMAVVDDMLRVADMTDRIDMAEAPDLQPACAPVGEHCGSGGVAATCCAHQSVAIACSFGGLCCNDVGSPCASNFDCCQPGPDQKICVFGKCCSVNGC